MYHFGWGSRISKREMGQRERERAPTLASSLATDPLGRGCLWAALAVVRVVNWIFSPSTFPTLLGTKNYRRRSLD